MSARDIRVNEGGRRIGQSHHRAKLTDGDVDLVLALREQGLSYSQIARKLDHVPGGVAKSTVRDICNGRTRAQLCAFAIKRLGDTREIGRQKPRGEPQAPQIARRSEPRPIPQLTDEEPGQRAMRLMAWALETP